MLRHRNGGLRRERSSFLQDFFKVKNVVDSELLFLGMDSVILLFSSFEDVQVYQVIETKEEAFNCVIEKWPVKDGAWLPRACKNALIADCVFTKGMLMLSQLQYGRRSGIRKTDRLLGTIVKIKTID